jgi:hypothetical protein
MRFPLFVHLVPDFANNEYSSTSLVQMSDNPDRNMKTCSQLSTYFKRHIIFRRAEESHVCEGKEKITRILQICFVTLPNIYTASESAIDEINAVSL